MVGNKVDYGQVWNSSQKSSHGVEMDYKEGMRQGEDFRYLTEATGSIVISFTKSGHTGKRSKYILKDSELQLVSV